MRLALAVLLILSCSAVGAAEPDERTALAAKLIANEQMSRDFLAAAGKAASREPSKAALAYRMAMAQLKAKYHADPR